MLLGLAAGYFLPDTAPYASALGRLFIKLLKLIVVPLIFVSLLDGIAQVGSVERLSKLGFKTMAFYLTTNLLAVATSLVLVNAIRPGLGVKVFGQAPGKVVGQTGWLDLVPENLFQAFAKGDSLQIIFLAILFGIALVLLNGRVPLLIQGIREANALLMGLTERIIQFAPLGVFGLMAAMVHALDWQVFIGIGKFAATILIGLAIHGLVTLPVFFKLFSSRSLLSFAKNMEPALLFAFSSSSSAATLPVTMACIEKEEKISLEIAGFVLPLGATVNMDGTAIYEATACLFIAQALGIELTFAQQIIVLFTAALAAIGAAAIPSAGLITLTMVLTAVGLPLEGIGFLLAIDRPLDMSRTIVNVWGDMVACAVVEGKRVKQ